MYDDFLPNTGGIAVIGVAGYALPIWTIGVALISVGLLIIAITRMRTES